MKESKRRFILSGLKLLDIFQLILSFGLATVLVAHGQRGVSLEQFLSIRVKLSNCAVFAAILLAWHIVFSMCGVYESKRLSRRRVEIIELLKAIALSTALLALLAELIRIRMITSRFLAFFWLISSLLFVAS